MSEVNIIEGNCLEALKRFKDKTFDWVIADPPYGIKGDSHRKNHSRGKVALSKNYHPALWDQSIPTKEYFDEIQRVSKNQIIFGINYFLNELDLKVGSGRIFWDKVNGTTTFSDGEIASISSIESTRLFRFIWSGMM